MQPGLSREQSVAVRISIQLQGQMLQLNFKAKRENYKQNLPRVRFATINSVLHVRAPAHVHTQRELRDLPCDTGYNGGEQPTRHPHFNIFLQPELEKIKYICVYIYIRRHPSENLE